MKKRLDQALVERGLAATRSQAGNLIRLDLVKINQEVIHKSGHLVSDDDDIQMLTDENYVSRAALKLKSVADKLHIDFKDKTVLDVGSSTGGFTDFALQHGARKVIAVDVGTGQMHENLRNDPRVELHEKTDIRDFKTTQGIDLVVADVSFISLQEILPAVARLVPVGAQVIAMVKPQFEAGDEAKHKGVIKNDKMRRNILKDFENWTQNLFIIAAKADSEVHGSKGNIERFYVLRPLQKSP
ncbi:MAG TPA: TlyA family RNA methyltransferase [Candidatus Saccharimonadales bacterium]|nr:TlyA family RNA methyltransferase [Candidatus Saccharimonadales bacterium]